MNESVFNFKDIVENLSDAIVITKAYPLAGASPEIVFANRVYCQQNGFTTREVIGKHSPIFQLIDSDKNTATSLPDVLESQYGPQPIHI